MVGAFAGVVDVWIHDVHGDYHTYEKEAPGRAFSVGLLASEQACCRIDDHREW